MDLAQFAREESRDFVAEAVAFADALFATKVRLTLEPRIAITTSGEEVQTTRLAGDIYGAGMVSVGPRDYPFMLLDEEIAPPEPLPISDVPTARDALYVLDVGYPSSLFVMGVPAPTLQFGPGGPIECAGRSGTAGALVTTPIGRVGLMTAGHVAPLLGSVVSSGSKRLGRVWFAEEPNAGPPFHHTRDVSVILLDDEAAPLSGLAIRATGISDGNRESITAYGRTGKPRSTEVLSFTTWFCPKSLLIRWDDVYQTQIPISDVSDSGAPVLLDDTRALIGHIVGGSPSASSYIQAIDTQLEACGCAFRPSP